MIQYKQGEDLWRKQKVFEEGDMVMEHLIQERFPKGTYNKLKYKNIRPWRNLRNFLYNDYKLELLETFDISLIFNIFYLYEFHEGE